MGNVYNDDDDIIFDEFDEDLEDVFTVNNLPVTNKELFGEDRIGNNLKVLTNYEYTAIISKRASEINKLGITALPMEEIYKIGSTNHHEIAHREFLLNLINYVIVRKYPNGYFEKWRLDEFKYTHYMKNDRYRLKYPARHHNFVFNPIEIEERKLIQQNIKPKSLSSPNLRNIQAQNVLSPSLNTPNLQYQDFNEVNFRTEPEKSIILNKKQFDIVHIEDLLRRSMEQLNQNGQLLKQNAQALNLNSSIRSESNPQALEESTKVLQGNSENLGQSVELLHQLSQSLMQNEENLRQDPKSFSDFPLLLSRIDEAIRELAQAIRENTKAIEKNTVAIEKNTVALGKNTEALNKNTSAVKEKLNQVR